MCQGTERPERGKVLNMYTSLKVQLFKIVKIIKNFPLISRGCTEYYEKFVTPNHQKLEKA